MSGNDIVFKIKNEMPVTVVFDRIEVPNGDIVNGIQSIARTIQPGQTTTVLLEKGWLSTVREATFFYYFDANGTRVDFHLYGYINDGIFGLSKSARYDLRAPGVQPNQTINVNQARYSAAFNADYVLVKRNSVYDSSRPVEFYEYHVTAVLKKAALTA